ncbi:uncharacterized protein [Haliotis cracherodii]|uniref:uncharacterized protein n=1 Tax=Haliotis cracherodii TaxID=6455 RepID=UPI0039ED9240
MAVPPSTTAVPPSTTAVPPSTTAVPSSTTTVPPSTTAVPPSTTAVPPSTTAAQPSTRRLPATTERSETTAENHYPLSPTPPTTIGQEQTPQSSFGIPQIQDEMPTRLIAAGVASSMIVLIAAIIAVALCRKPTKQKKRKPKPERKTGIGKSLGVTCGIRVHTTQVNASSTTAGVISTVIPNSNTQVFQVDIKMEREMAPQVSQHVVYIVESNEKLANGGKIQLVDTLKANIHDDFQTQDMNTYNISQHCPNQMPSQDQKDSCSVHEIKSPHVPIPGQMLEMSDQPKCTPAAGTQDVVAQVHEVPREFGVEETVPYKVNSERPVQHGEGALLPVVYEDRTTVSGEHIPGVLKEGNKVSGEHIPGVLKEGNEVSGEHLPEVLKEGNKVSGEHIPGVLKEGNKVSGEHFPEMLKEGNKVSGEHIPGVLKEGHKVSGEHIPEVLKEGNKVSGEHIPEVLKEENMVSGEHLSGVLKEGNKVSGEHLPEVLKEGNKVSGEHIPGVLKEGNKVSGEHFPGVLKEENMVSGEHLSGVLKGGNKISGEHLPEVLKEGIKMSDEKLPGVLKEGTTVSGEYTVEEQSLQSKDGTDITLHPRDNGEPSVQTEDGDDQSLQVQQPHTQHEEGINDDKHIDDIGEFKDQKVTIEITSNVRRFYKHRNVAYTLRQKVDDELERLEKQGIIKPVQYSDWAAPIVPVVKSNGNIRICGNYKLTVNKVARTNVYPIPRIEDLFSSLSGGKTFTKLDLSQAYQQLTLDEESQKLTTINTHHGLYQYQRLPFGISAAPAVFQRTMECLLKDSPHVCVYLDDILVTGASEQEHLENMKEVLSRLSKARLRLNAQKCKFMVGSVKYLGHKIDAQGLHPLDEKVKATVSAPAPRNVAELKSFLGRVQYYQRFLPNLATWRPCIGFSGKKLPGHGELNRKKLSTW